MTLSPSILPEHVLKHKLTGLALVWGWLFLILLLIAQPNRLLPPNADAVLIFLTGGKIAVWLGLLAALLFFKVITKTQKMVLLWLVVLVVVLSLLIFFFIKSGLSFNRLFFIQPLAYFSVYEVVIMCLSVCVLFCVGFIFMIIALNKNWITDYPFFYPLLKYWFKVGLSVVAIWILLHQFHIYQRLLDTMVGTIIYIIDYLTIELVIAGLILFTVVFLENYRLGTIILKILEMFAAHWIMQLSILLTLFLLINSQFFNHIILVALTGLGLLISVTMIFLPNKNNGVTFSKNGDQ